MRLHESYGEVEGRLMNVVVVSYDLAGSTMETLKTLLDSAKATTYELLALLLPGGALLLAVLSTLELSLPGGALSSIATSYAIGLALQGVADFLFQRWPLKSAITSPTSSEPRNYALKLIKKKLDDDVPSDAALDICLTCVESRRNVYDKFISLRDTARGLAIATLSILPLILYADWSALTEGSCAVSVARVSLVVAAAGVLFMAFVQRYARFHPLATQVVYGQFIGVQMTSVVRADHAETPAANKDEPAG